MNKLNVTDVISVFDKAENGSNFEAEPENKGYRFDIFKGKSDEEGKIIKVKSVGTAYLRQGFGTYAVHLKTFLKDVFYLLPNNRNDGRGEFVILTREPARNLGKKYYWSSVGDGRILNGKNAGLVRMAWDLLASDVYMSLYPIGMSDAAEMERVHAVA